MRDKEVAIEAVRRNGALWCASVVLKHYREVVAEAVGQSGDAL